MATSMSAYTASAQSTIKVLGALFKSAATMDVITFGASITTNTAGQVALVNTLMGYYGALPAGVLTSSPTFTGYAATATSAEFAATLIDTMTSGTSVSTTVKDSWKAIVVALLPSFASRGAAAVALMNLFDTYTGTDPDITAVNNVMDNRSEVSASAAQTPAGATFTSLTALVNSVSTVTNLPSSVVTAPATGTTYTLTSGVDIVPGTPSNDTVIADNTGTNKSLTAADQITLGEGIDTVKVYLAAADTSPTAPTLTGGEVLYVNGGAIVALDLTTAAYSSLTAFQSDASVAGANQAFTLLGTQSFSIANYNTAVWSTQLKYGSTVTAANVTVNAFGKSTVVEDLDINSGAAVATLNLTGATASSTMTLTNTGAALTTLNILGGALVNTTVQAGPAATIKTVDASAGTAGSNVNVSAATAPATFTFKGGSGNDTITFANDQFTTLTAGTQLDGGAGTADKIGLKDTALTAAETAKINAAVGFEVLGLNAAITLDASTLTSIKQFSIDTTALTQVISNMATGSKTTVNAVAAPTSLTLGTAVGVTDTTIALAAASAGTTITTLVTTGITNIALSSTGSGGNTITTLTNSDNTAFVVTGSGNLTITNALAGAATGSKVDASALTGKLTIVGSGQGDILIGGTAADTITAGAGIDTVTGGAGVDKFIVSTADIDTTAGAVTDTITDFAGASDQMNLTVMGAGSGTTYVEAGAVAASLSALLSAADTALNATVTIYVGQFGSDVYVVTDQDGTGYTDVIKLTGVTLETIAQTDFV